MPDLRHDLVALVCRHIHHGYGLIWADYRACRAAYACVHVKPELSAVVVRKRFPSLGIFGRVRLFEYRGLYRLYQRIYHTGHPTNSIYVIIRFINESGRSQTHPNLSTLSILILKVVALTIIMK